MMSWRRNGSKYTVQQTPDILQIEGKHPEITLCRKRNLRIREGSGKVIPHSRTISSLTVTTRSTYLYIYWLLQRIPVELWGLISVYKELSWLFPIIPYVCQITTGFFPSYILICSIQGWICWTVFARISPQGLYKNWSLCPPSFFCEKWPT